tara:strand:- start:49 stop:312 length:264 start_codon:yes stop_codon:yes gene_type:complete
VIELVNEYGFPIVAVVGMGWFIWFIYNYITNLIAEKLDQANVVLIALIDRIRMLDNDIIRLKSKINTVIELQELEKKKDEKKEENAK